VDEVAPHRIQEVGVLVNNVLIVEEEFVWLQKLLLFDHQLVGVFVELHYLIVFHIVVRYCLAAKHN